MAHRWGWAVIAAVGSRACAFLRRGRTRANRWPCAKYRRLQPARRADRCQREIEPRRVRWPIWRWRGRCFVRSFIDAGVVPVPHAGNPASVCLGELCVAYFTNDRGRPVAAETADTVGTVAQALARAGVHVEPARPPRTSYTMATGISNAYAKIAALRGQDVVEPARRGRLPQL